VAARVWLISDLHFDHENLIIKLKSPDGSFVRGQFTDVEHMNRTIIERWNSVVRPQDHVYMLGDVAISKRGLQHVKFLQGHLRLVRGNHDIYKTREYIEAGFSEIHGCRVIANLILTHVPIHPSCLSRFDGNVHGHIHTAADIPGKYLNVCVEKINYTPMLLEEAIRHLGQK
jgi:calcineurin-like phosphoesterase family protein